MKTILEYLYNKKGVIRQRGFAPYYVYNLTPKRNIKDIIQSIQEGNLRNVWLDLDLSRILLPGLTININTDDKSSVSSAWKTLKTIKGNKSDWFIGLSPIKTQDKSNIEIIFCHVDGMEEMIVK